MRSSLFVRSFFLLLAVSTPAFVSAQFQQPTPDELKMTSDPKAPGAAAVYLYREETTDDKLHFHSYYERIKVLTEKGKEQATITVPYERGSFKVTNIEGRTIHADGTVYLLTTKPADLVDVKSSSYQINKMVFTLPNAEVGCILEYRLQLRYDDNMVSSPTWRIQQPFYVHKAHYMFTPARQDGFLTITNSRGQVLNRLMRSVTAMQMSDVVYNELSGRYTVDLEDIPATPDEDWMPPLNIVNKRVEFYYTFAGTGKEFWDSEEKRWAKEVDHFTNPKPLKEAVAGMVAANDTDEQKARKIYATVMKLDNTDFSRKKDEAERKAEKLKVAKDAEDVWNQKSGTGDQIAQLYVALGRAAGLKVWPMQVVNRDRALYDPNYLNSYQLDDYLAIVEIGGKEVFLDPGQKMCPFGQLAWKHGTVYGFRLSDKGPAVNYTPESQYTSDVVRRMADVRLNADGSLKGTVRVAMTGPEALRWRHIALRNDPEEVKKQFYEDVKGQLPDGVEAEVDHIDGLDDPTVNLMATVKITGNLGTQTGKRVFLPGQFFESRGKHPFVAQEKRTTLIDLHFASMLQDSVVYHLPSEFALESSPKSADLQWPDHAMLRVRSAAKDGLVQIDRTLAHNFSALDPKDYNALRDFYLKVASADEQQLVLTQAPVAKGN